MVVHAFDHHSAGLAGPCPGFSKHLKFGIRLGQVSVGVGIGSYSGMSSRFSSDTYFFGVSLSSLMVFGLSSSGSGFFYFRIRRCCLLLVLLLSTCGLLRG